MSSVDTLGKTQTTSFAKTTQSAGYPWVAGTWYDLSTGIGNPKVNAYQGNTLEATNLDYLHPGNIWHGGLQTPATKHVTDLQVETYSATTAPGTLMLCDYVQFYPEIDCDSSAVQTMIPHALPRYTDGVGLKVFVVSTAILGPGVPAWIIKYTNTDGAHDRTLSWAPASMAFAIPGQLVHLPVQCGGPFLPLQAGDRGILSIESVQLLYGSGSGFAAVVLCKPLATIPLVTLGVTTERSYIRDLVSLPRIKDDAFLNFLVLPGAAVPFNSVIRGQLDVAWGP